MIVVVGGSGQLGSRLVPRLLQLDRVRVVSRHANKTGSAPDSVEFVDADVGDDDAVRTALRGATVVISLVQGLLGRSRRSVDDVDVDGNARLAATSAYMGAGFIMMSVIDAAPDADVEFFRQKWTAEQRARGVAPDTTIVRAPAFVEPWAAMLRDTRDRQGRPLVLGRGDNPINFVSCIDVADRLVALVDNALVGETINIEGVENVTMEDLAARLQHADGLTTAPRHLSPRALRLMAWQRVAPRRARLASLALALDRVPQARDLTAPLSRHDRRGTTSVDDAIHGPLS